jgi:hypothetical protein
MYIEERTMAPLKFHQFRSMLDCAINNRVGLGVKVFRKELCEKSRGDWSKFGRLRISESTSVEGETHLKDYWATCRDSAYQGREIKIPGVILPVNFLNSA